ncbi:MAG: hypothetical protein ACRDY2_01170, partial [Acidimicrobiales bacterium]
RWAEPGGGAPGGRWAEPGGGAPGRLGGGLRGLPGPAWALSRLRADAATAGSECHARNRAHPIR